MMGKGHCCGTHCLIIKMENKRMDASMLVEAKMDERAIMWG